MAFGLDNFYEENTWDIIPVGNVIVDENEPQPRGLEGLKTLVIWESKKAKKHSDDNTFPAKKINISGMFTLMYFLKVLPIVYFSFL